MAKNNKQFVASESLANLYFSNYIEKESTEKEVEEQEVQTEEAIEEIVTENNDQEVIDEPQVIIQEDTTEVEEEENTDSTTKELRDVRQSFLWTEKLTKDMNILVTMKYRNKRKSLNDLVVRVLEEYVNTEESQELIKKYIEFFGE